MIFIYDIKLVILSILIAIIAAYTALDLAGRVTVSQGKTQKLWLIGGATAMGISIWSMHFIGMLGYKLPIPIAYDLPTVIVSLIVPIVASLVALYLVSRQYLTKIVLFAGAIFMGFTIASMHYIGMAAMRMPAIAHYNPKLVILSVAIAITASLISLWLSFKLRQANTLTDILKKIGSALIMGTGIAGMHYIGMAAVTMQPSSQLSQPGTHILASSSLAVAIGIITFIILILTILTSLFEHHLDQQRNADLIKTNEELQNEIADRIQAQIALSQANQELKQNALRFQSLVSNIPGAVYRCKCDNDWTVDFISDAIFNISGYPASDFINNCVRTYDSIIHPEDRENVQTVVQQALAQH